MTEDEFNTSVNDLINGAERAAVLASLTDNDRARIANKVRARTKGPWEMIGDEWPYASIWESGYGSSPATLRGTDNQEKQMSIQNMEDRQQRRDALDRAIQWHGLQTNAEDVEELLATAEQMRKFLAHE